MSEEHTIALRKAASIIQKLRRELTRREDERHAPIAIVGLGCRFPGHSDDPAAYWRLFVEGRDGVGAVPPDRWDHAEVFDPDRDVPGCTVAREAAFVDAVDAFDAGFFRISPREARQMDPQQRVLLEVAWDALHDAGIAPSSLEGSPAGVFMGAFGSDFAHDVFSATEACGTYSATGALGSIIANRVSYLLGARGPSLTVDTACSSGLVAVHLAVRSLRAGECHVALAGAVSLMLTPGAFVSYSQGGMLSPDGRCFTFDHRANGFGRGEGAGVAVLKRLDDAVRDGDRIIAVIRGTAVNQDGRSNGLTAPSARAQQQVIRAALADGRVPADRVTYIETHGTGTALGDPIEVEALDAVYGASGRQPCLLGAHKTNVGHLEAAAGIAGLFKAALCLKHRFIPPNVNFEARNPTLDLDSSRLDLALRGQPWSSDGPRFAAISSFGIGGTNAHAVLEEAPAPAGRETPAPSASTVCLLPLSARTDGALRDIAGQMAELLDRTAPTDWPATCAAAAHRRDHATTRLAVVADGPPAAARALRELAAGDLPAGGALGRQPAEGPPRVLFVFSGQGGQWVGMGRDLYAADPAFARAVDAVDAAFEAIGAAPPGTTLRGVSCAAALRHPEVLQPALFAVQVGLAKLLEDRGVRADAVVGHSLGEVAAAHVCGALSSNDAARIVVARSRLAAHAPAGSMVSVELTEADAVARIDALGLDLQVTVVNDRRSAIVAGPNAAIDAYVAALQNSGVRTRRVDMSFAAHSAMLRHFEAPLREALGDVLPGPGHVPFISGLAGGPVSGVALGADHWARNLTHPVRFADAMTHAVDPPGALVVVEIGAHPVLARSIAQLIANRAEPTTCVSTLVRQTPGPRSVSKALGATYAAGVELDWTGIFPGQPAHVPLPAYPWEREHIARPRQTRQRRQAPADSNPLLARAERVSLATGGRVWTFDCAVEDAPALADHRVGDTIVFPGAGTIALAVDAWSELHAGPCRLLDIELRAPWFLSPDRVARAQLQLTPTPSGQHRFTLASADLDLDGDAEPAWTVHAVGVLEGGPLAEPGHLAAVDLDLDLDLDPDTHRRAMRALDFGYGPAFNRIVALSGRDAHRACAIDPSPVRLGRMVDVGGLDSALQLLLPDPAGDDVVYVPTQVAQVDVHHTPPADDPMWATAHITDETERTICGDVVLLDAARRPCVELRGITVTRVDAARWRARTAVWQGRTAEPDWPHRVDWQPMPASTPPTRPSPAESVIVAGPDVAVLERVQRALTPHVAEITTAVPPAVGAAVDGWLPDARAGRRTHLIYCPGPIPDAMDTRAVMSVFEPLIRVCRAIESAPDDPRLTVLGTGAWPIDGAPIASPVPAAVWGFGRSLALERPELDTALIDLDPAADAIDGRTLATALDLARRERQLARRGDRWYVPRLVAADPVGLDPRPGRPPAEQGTALIVGGLGHLGLFTARSLAERGVRSLLLMARSRPTETARETIDDLRAMGCDVGLVRADITDLDATRAALDAALVGRPLLRLAVHSAMVLRDGPLADLTPADFEASMGVKIDGAVALHRLLEAHPVERLFLFSSLSAVVGSAGQTHYAAANAFLDAFAHWRQARGYPTTTVGWGAWAGGWLEHQTDRERYLGRVGHILIQDAEGHRMMRAALAEERPHVVVARANWARYRTLLSDGGRWSTVLDRLVTETDPSAEDGARSALEAAPPESRLRLASAHIGRVVARVIDQRPEAVAHDEGFFAMGLDSLTSLELRNRLVRVLGVRIAPTATLDHPTVRQLATHVLDVMGLATRAERDVGVDEVQAMSAEALFDFAEQLLVDGGPR